MYMRVSVSMCARVKERVATKKYINTALHCKMIEKLQHDIYFLVAALSPVSLSPCFVGERFALLCIGHGLEEKVEEKEEQKKKR